MIRRASMAVLAILLALGWPMLRPDPGARAEPPLGIGTMAPGTLSHAAGTAIAETLVQDLGIEARVQPNAGETVLLALLGTGALDFAIANAPEAANAALGAGPFAGHPVDRLRVAAVLHPLRVGLFVRADGPIRSIADLRGRRVGAGYAASPAIASLLEAALAGGGIALSDIVPVPVPDLLSGAERFAEGRTDALFFALGAARVMEIAASTPLRLLPLSSDPGAVDRIRGVVPDAYVDIVGPRPGLPGVEAPLPVLAFDNLLVTRADLPDQVVTRVVAGLAARREALAARFAPLAGLDPDRMLSPALSAPYHPAAVAWAARR